MAPQHVDIADLASACRAIAEANDPSDLRLRVVIDQVVPAWLEAVAVAAAAAGASVAVVVSPRSDGSGPDGDAGHEIGVLALVLGLGLTDVEGVSSERIHRVQAVTDALAEAAPHPVVT